MGRLERQKEIVESFVACTIYCFDEALRFYLSKQDGIDNRMRAYVCKYSLSCDIIYSKSHLFKFNFKDNTNHVKSDLFSKNSFVRGG